ncbi:MAG: hypothetical protein F6K24_46550 [Okeania sp. SIO2D1]|nr:hypothetical protein [Okeania sp. SIO2D1]
MERFDEEKTNRSGEAIQDEKIFGLACGKKFFNQRLSLGKEVGLNKKSCL